MTAAITVTKPAVAIPAPVSNLNVTAAAASQNTGPVMGTMTVETTATKLTPTALTKVRTHCSRAHRLQQNLSVPQDAVVVL